MTDQPNETPRTDATTEESIEKACREARIHVSKATATERKLLLVAGKQLIQIGQLERELNAANARVKELENQAALYSKDTQIVMAQRDTLRERVKELEAAMDGRLEYVVKLEQENQLARKCVGALRPYQRITGGQAVIAAYDKFKEGK